VNIELGEEVSEYLRKEGYDVYLPIKETPRDSEEVIHSTNRRAIQKADKIVAVAKGPISRNWAFEVGYAAGLRKDIVCLTYPDNELSQHVMVNMELKNKVHTLEELKKHLK